MFELSRDTALAEQQVRALTFCLVAFAYVDGDLDPLERDFILGELDALAKQRAALGPASAAEASAAHWTREHRVTFEGYVALVCAHFTESVGDGETSAEFVISRLKLGCLEMLERLPDGLQRKVVQAVEQLMHADGHVHPNEAAFFTKVSALLHTELAFVDTDVDDHVLPEIRIASPRELPLPPGADDPLLRDGEWNFSDEPSTFAQQREAEIARVTHAEELFRSLRSRGTGVLAQATVLDDLHAGPRWLDGRVYAQRPDPTRSYELLVLGDLHGCYSCLKAALLQSEFFEKVRRHEADPEAHPETTLVLLGDYIDRGKFSYTGTLRAALNVFSRYPRQVVMLRGNHEHYVEFRGRVLAPVRPCEALDSLANHDGMQLLNAYRRFFDDLPTSFLFGDTLFVHGGIPRDATFEAKWRGLRSLNDQELAFEMMWSDPSDVDVVPRELQKEVTRFGFGRRQFQRFMKALGCRVLVRGHERITEGMRVTYDSPDAKLVTLFSAGGSENGDLPPTSNYRAVTPMALQLFHRAGVTELAPFTIDYRTYNSAATNALFASELAHVAQA